MRSSQLDVEMHFGHCFWHQVSEWGGETERGLDSHLYLWPLAAAVTDDEDTTKTRPADGRAAEEPELVIKTRTTDVGGRGRWRTDGRTAAAAAAVTPSASQ